MEGKADVVYGSRFIGESHRVLYFWHSLANKFLTMLSNMFTNLNLTDMEVCYKVFRREVIQGITLKNDRFGFEPEVTAKIARFRLPTTDGTRGPRLQGLRNPRQLQRPELRGREAHHLERRRPGPVLHHPLRLLGLNGERTTPMPRVRLATFTLALALLLTGAAAHAQSPPKEDAPATAKPKAKTKTRREPPGFYMGRHVADVMSYQGAEWLVRTSVSRRSIPSRCSIP